MPASVEGVEPLGRRTQFCSAVDKCGSGWWGIVWAGGGHGQRHSCCVSTLIHHQAILLAPCFFCFFVFWSDRNYLTEHLCTEETMVIMPNETSEVQVFTGLIF